MLSALPIEIMHAIYEYLETRDVKNLRQTSRTVGEVGLEYLVRKIYLFITEESIARVEALSLHPVISKRINAIKLCNCVCLPNDEDGDTLLKVTTTIHNLQRSLIDSGKFLASVEAILSRL